MPLYLDNNATTQVDPAVSSVMMASLIGPPANPSSAHSLGRKAKQDLLRARESVASFLKVKPSEILFTSGGTESLNFLLRGLSKEGMHILSSNGEHAAIHQTLQDLAKTKRCSLTLLCPTLRGSPSLEEIEQAITPQTGLLVFSAVNSETGVKMDLEGLSALALTHKLPLIIDGVALLGKELFSIPKGVTGMAFSGHKFHGPKGVGFTFLRSHHPTPPLLTGGGQEYGLRSGTENLPGILGLAKAIDLLFEHLPEATERMRTLRDQFEQTLIRHFPFIQVNGTGERICNVSNLAIPGVDAETLLIQLDLNGLQASHGSACSSGALEPSRVLLAMGLSRPLASSSLRFSLSRFTTHEEIVQATDLLQSLIPQLKT